MNRWLGIVLLFCLAMVVLNCGTIGQKLELSDPGDADKAAFDATEEYYVAKDAASMRATVEKLGNLAPQSAVYHDMAAGLAYMDARWDDRFEHVVAALLDTSSDVTLLNLHSLDGLSKDLRQTAVADRLMELLSTEHPDPDVRALAAYYLSESLYLLGRFDESRALARQLGWRLPLTVIGTWDNEQGKGFDIAYPPEEEISLAKQYDSQTVKVGWREKYPLRPQGEVDLGNLLHPSKWAVAYGLSAFEVKKAGEYELRISTSEKIKVWVNDALVFQDREIEGWSFDSIVIPITLNKGVNRVLIKSANDYGSWLLMARVTGVDGALLAGDALTPVKADSAPTQVDKTIKSPMTGADLVAKRMEKLSGGPTRSAAVAVRWANEIGLPVESVKLAEQRMKSHPSSLQGRYTLAMSLWSNSERGRTSDILDELMETAGEDFVRIQLKQARFWRQNDLERNARELLMALSEEKPDRPEVWLALASWFGSEDWDEDSCFAIERVNHDWPDWPMAINKLADCYETVDREADALELHRQLNRNFPGDTSEIFDLYLFAVRSHDFDEALELVERMAELRPYRRFYKKLLGEILRKMGRYDEAKKAWQELRDLAPTAPEAYDLLAHLEYYQKNKDTAIELWRQKIDRDPDDGSLANRLAFLEPPEEGLWTKDIPSETEIAKAVALRDSTTFDEAANTALLLDHAVAELKTDGSSVSVTTTIQHALNVSGRDAITKYSISCFGNVRILKAYALDKKGKRSEASSIRDETIRFRQLDVGSTIIVQSRCEQPPNNLIGDYFSTGWAFQNFTVQFLDSRYILWMAKSEEISEFVRGDIKREEQELGEFKRISWSALNIPVLKYEPNMPVVTDVAWRLLVSTVPTWDLFRKWEEALLKDAFRESPEIVALSEKLFKGLSTHKQKLLKIQAFLSTEIRYQMDYENMVAGVKPHAAPVVLARGYGDCKDKSVLFITLAKLAGIEVQFALVRTRTGGQIVKEVPQQQFNHAIVYVPKQKGLDEDIFFDPTADALDVDVLRSDDPGTWSLVLDRKQSKSKWRKIPYQSPDHNSTVQKIKLQIEADGSATGTFGMSLKGNIAALIRKTSRNPEQFRKFVQVVTNGILPGGMLDKLGEVDMDDVENPADFSASVKTDTFARISGKELYFKIPFDAQPEKVFSLETREYPLVFGAPIATSWQMELGLPKGAKVSKLPDPYSIETECVLFERAIKKKKGKLLVKQQIVFRCDEIAPEDYAGYRDKIQALRQVITEDVSLKLK